MSESSEIIDNIRSEEENEELSILSVETIDVDEENDEIDDEITINLSVPETEPFIHVEISGINPHSLSLPLSELVNFVVVDFTFVFDCT